MWCMRLMMGVYGQGERRYRMIRDGVSFTRQHSSIVVYIVIDTFIYSLLRITIRTVLNNVADLTGI